MKRFESEADLRDGEAFLSQADPKMADLILRFGPCTMSPWDKDLYTSLTSSIVSQQLSVKAAATIFSRLQALCSHGEKIDAQKLIHTPVEEIRGCGLSQAKTKYCLALAHAVTDNKLDLAHLRSQDDGLIITELTKIPGIGQWTAEMFLIFAVGSTDVLATADLGLKRGMQRYLQLEQHPTTEQFIAESTVWRPYRSLASWYLWSLAD